MTSVLLQYICKNNIYTRSKDAFKSIYLWQCTIWQENEKKFMIYHLLFTFQQIKRK